MSVSLSLNQFAQTAVPGMMDLINYGSNAQEAQLLLSSTNSVVAGQAVVLSPGSTNLPKVIPATVATDPIWGFVAFDLMKDTYLPGDRMTIARKNAVIHVIADAAIDAGQACEYAVSTGHVIASAGTNPVCGYAIAAAQAGELFRMQIA